jgi:arginyl-tRNA synthetase
VTPEDLAVFVRSAVRAAVDAGRLAVTVPDEVTVERPKNREHGDYATNVALRLARPSGKPPRQVAEIIAGYLRAHDAIKQVEVAGPGFINIDLAWAAQGMLARQIVEAAERFGETDTFHGQRINLEFISANPTGPLHLGHTRWAAVGDALARVLIKAAAEVTREFYVNDRGAQMDKFGASLMASAHGQPVPADGYHGAYIQDLAQAIIAERPDLPELPESEQLEQFRDLGRERQIAEQQAQLDAFRTHFDVWYSERSLYDTGRVEHALDVLKSKGHLYEKDGAVWMRTTDFGDDKDRVLVRSNGELTYFASDTAYYIDKRERGFDVCIYLLGADHHGYVGRLRAMAACAGDDPERNIEVPIGQLVKIVKGGAEVRLSKRAGDIITLQEIVDMTGVDALRYTLCRFPVDSPLTLDVEIITRQLPDNPVFYVQYAHSRLASLLRNAAELGVGRGSPEDFAPDLLRHDRESDLLGALGEFPRVVATAAELREPHRVARYLEELAGTYHRFYDACRVLPQGDEEATDLTRARLWLCAATQVVLRTGLDLLGVSAPERM